MEKRILSVLIILMVGFGARCAHAAVAPGVPAPVPAPPAPAAGQPGEIRMMAAFIGEMQGTAKVLLDGIEPWTDAKLAQKLTTGTRLRTDAKSSLTVIFTDRTKIKLGPNAAFQFEELSKSKVAVFLRMGRLDAWVGKLKNRIFQARNPVAVAAVRGSVFSFDVKSPTQVEMFFFSGSFAVMDNFGRSQDLQVRAGQTPQRMDADAAKGVTEPPKPAPNAPAPREPSITALAVLNAVQAASVMPPPQLPPGTLPPPEGIAPPPDMIPLDGQEPLGVMPPPLFPPPPFMPPPTNLTQEAYIAPPLPPPPISPSSP